jgi:hypothetical protein
MIKIDPHKATLAAFDLMLKANPQIGMVKIRNPDRRWWQFWKKKYL